MKRTITVSRNKDGTATIRSGRYVEHVDIRSKGPYDTYEAIRFAIITAGFSLPDEEIEELIQRGLRV